MAVEWAAVAGEDVGEAAGRTKGGEPNAGNGWNRSVWHGADDRTRAGAVRHVRGAKPEWSFLPACELVVEVFGVAGRNPAQQPRRHWRRRPNGGQMQGPRPGAQRKKNDAMRVAVSSQAQSLDGPLDQRFGRARFFVVFDTETGETELRDNRVNLNAAQGAGIQSAQNVAALGVDAVVTGHIGPNAFRALSAAGVAVYTGAEGTVAQALEALGRGELALASAPDVEGHWGS